ncbi:fibrinogen-binding adhesin SdrG C-terminal domain-containing protein [Limosilactobacillus sp. WF-MT5-A]|uniref:fibrinogen-binding adhesin SdrG C-terminal domain-containing protein n=1 Tax=Limosilactobacillus agrestis TaxID=2759748 RepID=UPI0015FDE2D0|nr:fibrinogen-binding adhesin SdrG C-terminal domain-containing protein [Limosilactobacillus agrestis]MBB1100285.1 fibrinogen-binding adhesin SdrG C-terminal domain-containing protein [Limosilactobacillus agrestis]MCD7126970.1 fibrinogen-binding adhesin SdrG C-terminal domain-containing protein [Limosilactobacillus agrestis]
MDNYQAMNYYYGLLNLRAGFFKANLCEGLTQRVASVSDDNNQQVKMAYHAITKESHHEQSRAPHLEFGSFYKDGHILHNVKINTQSEFFLDPTRGDAVKWHVDFTVAKDVRPADQFIIQLSPNLIVAPNGHPQNPIPDFTDQNGTIIAGGKYHPDQHQLVYTFTNYVVTHQQIIGELTGDLAIDPLTTPENEFGLACFIDIDGYRKDFTIDVDYPDLDNDTFLGISSRMMKFDQDQHLFTDLIYVNPAQKDLNHAYIIFNTSDLVEELSNAIVQPATMRIEIYRNSHGLKLPQSYGVDLQRLREVTNRFPMVESDHLVETPLTMSFADNKMRLNFTADDTKDSYVIKVIGQYNDELDGAVRLRARLFGVDQQNVYMSNSTVAMADGVPMQVNGQAVLKANMMTNEDGTSRDSEEPTVVTAGEPQRNTTVNTSLRAENSTVDYPTENDKFEERVSQHDVADQEPSSDELEDLEQVTAEQPITLQHDHQALADSVNSAEPAMVRSELSTDSRKTKEERTINDSEELSPTEVFKRAVEKRLAKGEVQIDETSTAPLPMPERRPPRRKTRLRENNRLNHSLRHLRRF